MSVGVSLSGLASAVAREGGIGVIGAAGIGMLESDFSTNFKSANCRALRKEIRLARQQSHSGLLGVNIMVALSDYEELCQVAIEEEIDFIFLGAGLPLKNPLINAPAGKKLPQIVPIVSSARSAQLIFSYWQKNYQQLPDAVVVEGPKAGGHLGFKPEQLDNEYFQLEKLVAEVIKTLTPFSEQQNTEIPVIAAGGIFSGNDIARFLKLGAAGVQMATRFVPTQECDAAEKFKQAYLKCKKEDLIIIKSPVGLPGRAIKNSFLEQVAALIKRPFRCPWKCLRTCDFRKAPYCIALALTNAKRGKLNDGFVFAGANAYLSEKIVSVKELIAELEKEFLLYWNNPLPQKC